MKSYNVYDVTSPHEIIDYEFIMNSFDCVKSYTMKNIKSYMYAVQSWRMVTFSFVGGAPDIQTFMVHLFGLGMQLFVCLSFWPSVYARVGFAAAVSMNGCWLDA